MYGDKDTYSLGFALAGKAHVYQHAPLPPGGVFTHRDALGWQPDKKQVCVWGGVDAWCARACAPPSSSFFPDAALGTRRAHTNTHTRAHKQRAT